MLRLRRLKVFFAGNEVMLEKVERVRRTLYALAVEVDDAEEKIEGLKSDLDDAEEEIGELEKFGGRVSIQVRRDCLLELGDRLREAAALGFEGLYALEWAIDKVGICDPRVKSECFDSTSADEVLPAVVPGVRELFGG